MSNHARVEELSDSDPDEVDISSLVPAAAPSGSILDPQTIPTATAQASGPRPHRPDPEKIRNWQCIYPVYFDAKRSREEGRRVSKDLAVHNPLAREICDAVFSLGFQLDFEIDKSHPKDWANPGRVRVLLKQDGEPVHKTIRNKQHLFNKVAEHLQTHPPDENTPMRVRIAGMPPMSKPPGPPAVPQGFKMGTILPLHSPAVSGGGVSENLFKDMMAEMSGQSPQPDATSGPKPKKEKKNKKG